VAPVRSIWHAFPDLAIQWLHRQRTKPIYRCGGSAGIALAALTGFPFQPSVLPRKITFDGE
jgi:hypothetical protein